MDSGASGWVVEDNTTMHFSPSVWSHAADAKGISTSCPLCRDKILKSTEFYPEIMFKAKKKGSFWTKVYLQLGSFGR